MDQITNTEAVNSEMPQKEQKQQSIEEKKRRISFLNILTGIILVIAVVFLIQAFYTHANLHNNYFGYAILPVKTDSMKVDENSIAKGDLVFIKLLSGKEKTKLKVGDIITFKNYIEDQEVLLTHRIIEVSSNHYVTHGDANAEGAVEAPMFDKVVGVYKGKIDNIGHVGLFFETRVGSFIMIVVPFLLLLLLSVFQFIRSLRVYNKEKIELVTEEARSSVLSEEKERMRLEILAELEREKSAQNKKE